MLDIAKSSFEIVRYTKNFVTLSLITYKVTVIYTMGNKNFKLYHNGLCIFQRSPLSENTAHP